MSQINAQFKRLLPLIEADLLAVLAPPDGQLDPYHIMMHYHMGWVDPQGQPAEVDRGKRIRPVMTILSAEAAGGHADQARPAAAALELIHNFSLLHDDIQDRSPSRRGRATAWTLWGEAQAINAGDAMFTLAHLAIPRLGRSLDASRKLDLLVVLDETSLALTHGQHRDMSFETRDQVAAAEYLQMIEGKTAALTGACAEMGAISAGATADQRREYRAFGHGLGMAFQVRDDILDIWGDPALTGKEAAVDIWQRKKSYPVLVGLERSADLRALYGDPTPFDEPRVAQIIELLDAAGAREEAMRVVREHSAHTVEHLQAAQPQGEAGQALFELVELLLERQS